MANVSAIELKVGNLIRYKNSMYRVVKTEHVKPGKGGAFIQAELKDIKTGTKLNDRFRSDQTVDKVMYESKPAQYLYKNGNDLEFMDLESYEQFALPATMLSGPVEFLQENMELMILNHRTDPSRGFLLCDGKTLIPFRMTGRRLLRE